MPPRRQERKEEAPRVRTPRAAQRRAGPPAKKVPSKLHLEHPSGAQVAPSNSIKDGVVVVMGFPGRTMEITFHHPIGVTQLMKDDWVATPTYEVANLLARATDTYRVHEQKSIDQRVIEGQIAKRLLQRDEAGNILYWDGTNRSSTKKDLPPRDSETLPPEVRYKIALEAAMSSERKALMSTYDASNRYETRSGPNADQPQVALSGYRGLTKEQLLDKIAQNLLSPLTPLPRVESDAAGVVASAPTTARPQLGFQSPVVADLFSPLGRESAGSTAPSQTQQIQFPLLPNKAPRGTAPPPIKTGKKAPQSLPDLIRDQLDFESKHDTITFMFDPASKVAIPLETRATAAPTRRRSDDAIGGINLPTAPAPPDPPQDREVAAINAPPDGGTVGGDAANDHTES